MWRNVIAQALFQVTVLLIFTFKGNDILKLKKYSTGQADKVRNTVIFNAFVFCQIFNEFNSRKPDQKNIFEGLFSSHLFIAIISITLVLQVLIVEFAGKFASTTPLDWKKWILCIVIGFLSWPLAVIAKFIPVAAILDRFGRKKSSSEHGAASDGRAEMNREQSHPAVDIV